ncbi:hypothetical protein Sulku_2301 [Sulfuricurvum kujiense DSM 16994]|uniref:Uncharacterized protein n=1 Tax=Sulfuricurvum kujiense (strain ATCC BAA-921 / DSM 16994 / JCM 11577 / YK-1) TaxID=709032 RepID=E4TX95_SULKY|nr:hypothetical protein [Sulfuricurvum kujiense]ADR34961.1 hypothetical protein Sulku_2301 [Sulfuricurvum kujiense DSM 16994]
MKQYNTFEDLQALGTEKIHERTHISRDKIELVLTKSYAQIGRVQFMGYISILEREYDIDLSGIKEEYLLFCQNNPTVLAPKQSVILQAASNSKPKWIVAGTVLIIILMIGGYFLQGKMSAAPSEDVMNLTTSSVQVVEQNDTANAETNETNITGSIANVESNQSAATSVQSAIPAQQNETLITGTSDQQTAIIPQYKVWYGVIDLESGKKIQGITIDPIIIDPTKTLLIVLGHGRVELISSEGKKVLNDKNTVHFIGEKGALKQISQQEFMERNGGKNW